MPDSTTAFPRFPADAVLVVDAHNGNERWTGQRWNDYATACEDPVNGGMFIVRLVKILDHGTEPAAKPMTYEELAEIRLADAKLTDADLASGELPLAYHDRRALVREAVRLADLFEKLAAVVGRLDFDRGESGLPETQEQWIEFVRELDDSAQKIIDQYEPEEA